MDDPTMSSREIATLCDKEHRHVLRDIDNLNETYEKMGLPKVGHTPTMSSREIATLCDKRHDHVCQDIENLNLEYGKLSLPKVGETPYTHEQNGQT